MRSDQHPFTPEPHEPEPWADHPAADIARWNPEQGYAVGGIGMDSQLIFDVTEAIHKAWEEKRRREEAARDKARGFRLGFGEVK